MDGLNLGFWMCSCCNQVFHTDLQRPVNLFGNELFKCALCNAVNQKHELSRKVRTVDEHVRSVAVMQTLPSVSDRSSPSLSH